jgi:hypothetical protein
MVALLPDLFLCPLPPFILPGFPPPGSSGLSSVMAAAERLPGRLPNLEPSRELQQRPGLLTIKAGHGES